MMKVAATIVLLFVCTFLHASQASTARPTAVSPYQPECNSLDGAIQNIQDSTEQLTSLGLSSRINCTRNDACDGFRCLFVIQRQKMEMSLELRQCEDPPQMIVLVQDPDSNQPYIEETVTNEDTFDIPGLQLSYLMLLQLGVALNVEFEKVSEGFQIGLNVVFQSGGMPFLEVPLLQPTVINTPDCPTPGVDTQCTRMQELVESLNPPHDFQCNKNDDCRGFNCEGEIPVPGGLGIPVTAKLSIDSCADPISYNIILKDGSGTVVWNRTFTHSESTMVDVRLPPGVTANLNITMDPSLIDIDYMRTTIALTLCIVNTCETENFIDRGLVPIPPCDHPLTTPTRGPTMRPTPATGASDECQTMQAVVRDIMNNELFDHSRMECQVNMNCSGFICNMDIGHEYNVGVMLFHCEDPIRLLFTIDDQEGYHLRSDIITQSAIVPIDRVLRNGSVKFFLAKRSNTAVEIAVTIQVAQQDGSTATVPLVEDRIITVAACPTTPSGRTVMPVETTTVLPKTKPPPTKLPPTKLSPTKPVDKNTMKPTSGGKNGGNSDKNKSTDPKSNGVSIGVGIGVAVVVAAAVIFLFVMWRRRHNRRPSDHLTLVENSEPI